MSKNNNDESFDFLAHEKSISELYQKSNALQTEQPSARINAEIMAMAKQQVLDNPSILTKNKSFEQQPSANENTQSKTQKAWYWPFSLVASVGLLGVLFITQRDYFIHPSNVGLNDTNALNEPIMRAPTNSQAGSLTDEVAAGQSIPAMQIVASTQRADMLSDQEFTAEARKKIALRQTPKAVKEQSLTASVLEDNSGNKALMSLAEMSKLVELLELAKVNGSELEASTSSVKMQQTLFEGLLKYQNRHGEFKVTEKYLNVLTEKQIQQLQASEIVPTH